MCASRSRDRRGPAHPRQVAVTLRLLSGLYWLFASMPDRVFRIARNELARAYADDEAAAEQALREAADRRIAPLIQGLKQAHEQATADLRRQLADAELRARLAERHAADTSTALEAAATLTRELRAAIDALAKVHARAAEATEDVEEGRKTVEMKPSSLAEADDAGWDDPEEHTKVFAPKPAAIAALHASRRPTGAPRTAIPPPPITAAEER